MFPERGSEFIAARARLGKPVGPVFLVLTGSPVKGWALRADPGRHADRYDLRMLVGLWVCLVIPEEVDEGSWINVLVEAGADRVEVYVPGIEFGYEIMRLDDPDSCETWDEEHKTFIQTLFRRMA